MGGHGFTVSGTTGGGGGTSSRRALFSFDITGNVPGGATINSISLTLNVPVSGGVSSTFDLFRLLVPWGEGTNIGNNGSAAFSGDATWNSNRVGTSSWSTPGGVAGIDFAATASATTFVNGVSTFIWSSATMVADVQTWLNTPANNNGWILISELEGTGNTAARFSSREDAGNEPSLAIDFTVAVPEPGTGILLGLGTLLMYRRYRT